MQSISNISDIFRELIGPLFVLALCPLYAGVLSKFRAMIEGRTGPKILQPYFDLYKLSQKEIILPKNSSWIFKLFPYLSLGIMIFLSFVIPVFSTQSIFANHSDLIFIFGLMLFVAFLSILSAADAGTSFVGMGASREAFLVSLIEPTVLMVIMSLAIEFQSSNLYQIVSKNISDKSFLNHPNMIFTAFAFLVIIIIECKRFPVDNPNTHLELTMVHEALLLEYSGKYLAILEYSSALKLTLLSSLFFSIFYPNGISTNNDLNNFGVALLSWGLKMLAFAFLFALFEKSTSKLRIFRVPELISFSLAMAVISIFAHYFTKV